MRLYHGSNMEIDEVDLTKCMPYKDFGQGFYTTILEEQAWRMAQRRARFIRNNRERSFSDIESTECNHDNKYDVVVCPVADDTVGLLLRQFSRGTIDVEYLKLDFIWREHLTFTICIIEIYNFTGCQEKILDTPFFFL